MTIASAGRRLASSTARWTSNHCGFEWTRSIPRVALLVVAPRDAFRSGAAVRAHLTFTAPTTHPIQRLLLAAQSAAACQGWRPSERRTGRRTSHATRHPQTCVWGPWAGLVLSCFGACYGHSPMQCHELFCPLFGRAVVGRCMAAEEVGWKRSAVHTRVRVSWCGCTQTLVEMNRSPMVAVC
jgi:hypothetical protein